MVVCKPHFQDGVDGLVQVNNRHDGTRNCAGGEILGIEVQTTCTIHGCDDGIDTASLLECPVTNQVSCGDLLDGPGLLRTIAECFVIVGFGHFQNEVHT